MASHISDTSSSDVAAHEIPPPVLDVQEEVVSSELILVHELAPLRMVAMEPNHGKQEVEVPEWLKVLVGNEAQDWRAFVSTRSNGHKDKTYTHKEYRHQFRSKREVKLFVDSKGMTTGIFKGRKLQKKKIADMDTQDAGTSKSAGRRASASHARPKRSFGQSRSIDDEEMPPGFL